MEKDKWLKKNCNSLRGKTVVVTGATGGLGRVVCEYLAQLDAHIVLACRNKTLADDLTVDLKSRYSDIKIAYVSLDLSDINSVNSCIKELRKLDGIDVLINNAGVYNVPLKKLDSGYNNVFQINFLYTYYLTKQLLPELEKKENSVCITLGSVAHNYSKLDENDIDFSTRKKSSQIYGNSKRFLMFSLYELFENSKVKLSIVHPGVTLTNMTNHYPKVINWLVKIGIKLLFPSPKKATRSVIYGLQESTGYHEWVGPKICNVWGNPKKSKLNTCSPDESKKIFELAEKLCNDIK